ncbi:putative 5-3 exonuclease, partial [Martensiomyces pterosporus]
FHTLFIDLNSTLHRDASASNGDVASISSTVDELIALVKPKRLVYLAIDGVPPRMKERLQRERRAKAVDVRNLMDQRGQQHSSFNSYAITPGTKWMRKVERHLEEYITQKRKVDARWRDLRVVFSGSRDPGEGEQKIMEYLRTQESSSMGDSHCVWSNDADTVLLSLATHVRNITMVSERQRSGVSS